MSGETKIDDELPFVLQNCSAMSRQAAMSTEKPKRGWGFGWLRGNNNNNNNNTNSSNNNSNNNSKRDGNKDTNIAPKKSEDTVEVAETGTDSTISEPDFEKPESPPPIPSSDSSSSSLDDQLAPATTAINPPSPKSLSPRSSKPAVRRRNSKTNSINESEDKLQQQQQFSTGKSFLISGNESGGSRDGVSPNELSRRKRREEVRQKTAWYEEYIRNAVKNDGLSSLNKDEVVALSLFEKQRRIVRRIRLFGRQDSDNEMDLTDNELEQLLDLANRCNEAQIDEAEMEMLLVQMENGNAVDMDRLYHLELRSRRRVGEILNEEELDALQALDEKKRDTEVFAELSLKKKRDGGIDDDDESRLEELTLLQRKRNGNRSLTPDELEVAEILEMRREDARLNAKDYKKLLRLKQQGIDVDEDRLSLLSLLDRKRRGSKLTEDETEILEQYFELREEEYLERIEYSTATFEKKDGQEEPFVDTEESTSGSLQEDETETELEDRYPDGVADTEESTSGWLQEDETETEVTNQHSDRVTNTEESTSGWLQEDETETEVTNQYPGGDDDEDEPTNEIGQDSEISFLEENNSEQIDEKQFDEAKPISQQCATNDRVANAPIETKNIKGKYGKMDVEDIGETKSTLTFDELDLSNSECEGMAEFQERLKKNGLPLLVSFDPIDNEEELDMSGVSFSDDTYVKDLLCQQEDRASERKEECLEEAYKIYKRTNKKERLPESEERLLTMFAKILKQRNKEMREADEEFDKLVEREVFFYERRKQDEEDRKATKEAVANGGGNESVVESTEETSKNNTDVRSKNEHSTGTGATSLVTAESDDIETSKTAQKSKMQAWGKSVGFFRRDDTESIEGEETTVEGEGSTVCDDNSPSSEEVIETVIESIESMPGSGNTEEIVSAQGTELTKLSVESEDNEDQSSIVEDYSESLEGENLDENVKYDVEVQEIDEEKFIKTASDSKMRLFLQLGVHGKEEIPVEEETVDSELTIPQDLATKEERLKGGTLIPMMTILSNHSRDSHGESEDSESPEFGEDERKATDHERDHSNMHGLREEGTSFVDNQPHHENSEGRIRLSDSAHSSRLNNSTHSTQSGTSVSISSVESEEINPRRRRQKMTIERKGGTKDISRQRVRSESTGDFTAQNEELDAFESSSERIEYNINLNDETEMGGNSMPDIEDDLLYELELVHRLKKGIRLTERQRRELDLLMFTRRGGTLSLGDLKDSKRLKRERGKISIHLRELHAQKTSKESAKEDLLYELELFHKALADETLSVDEKIEMRIFERHMNGQILTEDDLEKLDFLRKKRPKMPPTTSSSAEVHSSSGSILPRYPGVRKEPLKSANSVKSLVDYNSTTTEGSISGRSNHRIERSISNKSNHRKIRNQRVDQSIGGKSNHRPNRRFEKMMSGRSMMSTRSIMSGRSANRLLNKKGSIRRLEKMISRRSTRLLNDPQSMMEDDDSVYRRDLYNRQKAGQRLDKKEFRWLQILMKKSRKEELDKDDLDELEIMRSQRNETDVYFVNTKKLIEEEMKRNRKKKEREKRRKEKIERRNKRREEKKQRKKNERMRRRNAGRVELQKIKSTSDEDSQDGKKEIQIIGTPAVFEEAKKEEPVMGVFGGVFGKSAQKRRQEKQLEEAKRLQAELIKEQMKALALENEAEELEREKVMQQQLVEETIEKKKADSVDGSSSFYTSSDDNWFDDTSEDSSSWSSSWETSSSEESSQSEELERKPNIQEGPNNSDMSKKPAELSSSIKEVVNEHADVASNGTTSSRVTGTLNHSADTGKNPTDDKNKLPEAQMPDHSENAKRRGSGSRGSGSKRGSSLGGHLKKRRKKRTKDGDDMSLGTLQLSKVRKEGIVKKNSGHSIVKEEKIKSRPWVIDDQNGTATSNTKPDIARNGGGIESLNAEATTQHSMEEIDRSFVSNIASDDGKDDTTGRDDDDGEAQDRDETEASFFSESGDIFDDDTEKAKGIEQSLLDSLANSFTSIGEEVYDLGLQEYENMESRLGDRLKHKQAEFDLTWETTFADENVIAQINQRLRERQRAMEAKREKKKEKKEIKNLLEVPRLYLFEGERVLKNGKKRKNKSKKKLDRTLTNEFRKAMKEIFDYNSDSDDEYLIEYPEEKEEDSFEEGEEEDENNFLPRSLRSPRMLYADDDSDPLSFSENDHSHSGSIESDEEDDKFDGEYLTRLKERSLPAEMKKMLSGRISTTSKRHMASRRNLNEISEHAGSPKGGKRPRRKKNGEIVNNYIDPAEVYIQELEKQKKEKTFTVAGLRKELESAKRTSFKDFVNENKERFGNFDHLATVPLKKAAISRPKKVNLGKGVESLDKSMSGARSVRSLGTATVGTARSDEGLLTGKNRRQGRRRIVKQPETIDEDDNKTEESGDLLMATRENSDEFKIKSDDTSIGVGTSKLVPNMKLMGGIKAIKKKFKTTKKQSSAQFEDIEVGVVGGGLLGNDGGRFDDNSSLNHNRSSGVGIELNSFVKQEPLPVPAQDYDDETRGTYKVTMKGVLSTLKLPSKLPSKLTTKNILRKGSIMMDDDGEGQ